MAAGLYLGMKKAALYIMALFYMGAGINHFIHPRFYTAIMPSWLQWHSALVLISGIAELLLGIFLIPVSTRRVAAWGLIALLVAVFPANVQMMMNYIHEQNPKTWISILRLPLQALLIWWAWIYTKPSK